MRRVPLVLLMVLAATPSRAAQDFGPRLGAVKYKDCGVGGDGALAITIEPTGTVSSVKVVKGDYDPKTAACLWDRFRKATFPPFEGDKVVVRWSVSLGAPPVVGPSEPPVMAPTEPPIVAPSEPPVVAPSEPPPKKVVSTAPAATTTAPDPATTAPDAVPEPPKAHGRWYGGATLAADGIALGLLLLAIPASLSRGGDGAVVLGVSAFAINVLGPPIIHWTHDNVGGGFASLGMRLGAYLLVGVGAASASRRCDDACVALVTLGVAGILVAGPIVDASVLAYEPTAPKKRVPARRVAPVFAPWLARGAAGASVFGAF